MKVLKKILQITLIFLLIFVIMMFGVFYTVSNDRHQPYMKLINKYSQEYNIERELLFSVIKAESSFNKNAVSKVGASGLMQLMPDTAKWISSKLKEEYNKDVLKDPEKNIKYGSYYLSYLIGKFRNIDYALMAYNAGPGNVEKWIHGNILIGNTSDIENIPFNETKNYVKKIKENYRLNKKIYDFYYDTNDSRIKRTLKLMGHSLLDIFKR